MTNVLRDPYANAFNYDANGQGHQDDQTSTLAFLGTLTNAMNFRITRLFSLKLMIMRDRSHWLDFWTSLSASTSWTVS